MCDNFCTERVVFRDRIPLDGRPFLTPPSVAAVRRTLHGLVLREVGHEINHGRNRLPIRRPPLPARIPQENGGARGQREARHGDVWAVRQNDHGPLRTGNENNVVSVAAVIAEQRVRWKIMHLYA